MKFAILTICVVAAAASTDTFFAANEAPKCFVDAQGNTIVHYKSDRHDSFKCTHEGSVCACTAHPTHKTCMEFDHTSGTTHQIGGDCSDAGLRLVTDASGCTTNTDSTCEKYFNGCIMHHGTAQAYCKMPVSTEFKTKYEAACAYGGALYNEFDRPGMGDKTCTVVTNTIHGRGPDNMDQKYKSLLDEVCKYHGDSAGVAGLSNANGYFGSTQSPGAYRDEANCYATGSPFAEQTISQRGGKGLSCRQGQYYKYWATPSVLACKGGALLGPAPASLTSLTTAAPTRPATTCGSFSGADSMHCPGTPIKQWPQGKSGSQAECVSFCQGVGATCVVWQSSTTRCFCKEGVRSSGCNGCTARITFAASCS
eukprot:g5353.t1